DEEGREGVCCHHACTLTSDPVCGSDGQSYRSPCEMRAMGCTLQKDIRIQHKGPCGESKHCRAHIKVKGHA
uniref:Kazal-like domain-containing protein n=1 Tax=Xiphophorus couchianus TaxID=32473 RepID=A0A3B5KIV7_9TELE